MAAVAALGLAGGQAFAQDTAITVRDAPIHKVPSDAADAPAPRTAADGPAGRASRDMGGPVEDNAVPDTLNAQFAAQSRPAPAFLSRASAQTSAPPAAAEPAAERRADAGPSAPIAGRIIDAAGAFEAYMRKTSAISAKFADPTAVSKALGTGAAYEIQQFQEGATAYAALAALQDPAFVQGVYDLGRDPRERAAMAQRLIGSPDSVMDIDGADEAAAMVGGVLARMGTDLVHAGLGVKQAAYDVQHQAWSKEDVSHADQRLAATKAVSTVKVSLNAADTDALIRTIVALRKAESAAPGPRGGEPSPVVVHGLAIAALAVMGRAGEAQIGEVAPLLTDAKSADFMKMAKLNLYQCMAAAGPEYEDVFCLGAHAMVDTGQCLVAASGQSPIPEGSLQRASAPASPAARSISVPMALMSTEGPERQRARARPAERLVPVAPSVEEIAAADETEAPAPALRDYAEQQPVRRQPRAYAPAPRPAPRDEAYDDRAPPAYDRYDDRYSAPARPDYRDDDRQDDGTYADAYGPYRYGR